MNIASEYKQSENANQCIQYCIAHILKFPPEFILKELSRKPLHIRDIRDYLSKYDIMTNEYWFIVDIKPPDDCILILKKDNELYNHCCVIQNGIVYDPTRFDDLRFIDAIKIWKDLGWEPLQYLEMFGVGIGNIDVE
jgi:hypothetical protein